MTYVLNVKDQFHQKPYGRLPEHDHEANGQLFRTTVLRQALAKHDHVTVDFTGINLVGTSFLDEAFAGLVYHDGFTEAEVRERINILIPSDPSKVTETWEYVSRAEKTERPSSRASMSTRAAHA